MNILLAAWSPVCSRPIWKCNSSESGSQSSGCKVLLTRKTNESEISGQARNTDILQYNVSGTRKRVRHGTGDILWRDHFVTRPFALDLSPDVGVCSVGVNVNHPDFTIAQFFTHALRKTFKGKLAHAISAPVCEASFRGD